jgi:hypothetical protein
MFTPESLNFPPIASSTTRSAFWANSKRDFRFTFALVTGFRLAGFFFFMAIFLQTDPLPFQLAEFQNSPPPAFRWFV